MNSVARWFLQLCALTGLTAAVYYSGRAGVWLPYVLVYATMARTLQEMWDGLRENTGSDSPGAFFVFPNAVWAFMWWWVVLVVCTQVYAGYGKDDWMSGCVMLQAIVTLEAFKEYEHNIKPHKDMDSAIKALENMAVAAVEFIARKMWFVLPLALLVICIYFFAQSNVTPWGIPYMLFTVPVAYTAYRLMNIKQKASPFLYVVVMIFVTLLLFYPATFTDDQGTVAPCPTNANAGACGLDYLGVRLPNMPHCCCAGGYTPFGDWNRCSQCSTLNAKGEDCCGNKINYQNEPFISGVTQCLCNSKANKTNVFLDEKCMCGANYCGKSCETFSRSACSQPVEPSKFAITCENSQAAVCTLKA